MVAMVNTDSEYAEKPDKEDEGPCEVPTTTPKLDLEIHGQSTISAAFIQSREEWNVQEKGPIFILAYDKQNPIRRSQIELLMTACNYLVNHNYNVVGKFLSTDAGCCLETVKDSMGDCSNRQKGYLKKQKKDSETAKLW